MKFKRLYQEYLKDLIFEDGVTAEEKEEYAEYVYNSLATVNKALGNADLQTLISLSLDENIREIKPTIKGCKNEWLPLKGEEPVEVNIFSNRVCRFNKSKIVDFKAITFIDVETGKEAEVTCAGTLGGNEIISSALKVKNLPYSLNNRLIVPVSLITNGDTTSAILVNAEVINKIKEVYDI